LPGQSKVRIVARAKNLFFPKMSRPSLRPTSSHFSRWQGLFRQK
jgi:hypothetical protein